MTPSGFPAAEAVPDLATRLHPRAARWFARRWGREGFTEAQRLCLPHVLAGESVLLLSPTGSGKTLAGFLGVLSALLAARDADPAGKFPPGIFALYVSPLRALAYDIRRNLQPPLDGMKLADEIHVGARTGDTTPAERRKMRDRPPHLLLTTPESLALLLAQPAWQPVLARIRFVIVDEVHAFLETPRGADLSLSLERLERCAPGFCRVGLSATVGSPEIAARWLVGEDRPCRLAQADAGARRLDVAVYSPLRRNPYPPSGEGHKRLLEELAGVIRTHRSVLVFTQTRSRAEALVLDLHRVLPRLSEKIEIHHGSLDRDVRLDVEERLKAGELRAVVCSASLELGVDIGAIDLVVLLGSPKSVARSLQRAGRSGRSLKVPSRALFAALNVHDLLECAVIARLMRARRLEPLRLPPAPRDVLVQHVMGMIVAEPGITPGEIFRTLARAAPFADLPSGEVERAAVFLAGGGRSLEKNYAAEFGKIVVSDGRLHPAGPRAARQFLMNAGTIPSEAHVRVRAGRRVLGWLDEDFVKWLKPGDVFVLAGKVVRMREAGVNEVKVDLAPGARPNVPIWTSRRMPLESHLAEEVNAARGRLGALDSEAMTETLAEEWGLSLANAQAVARQFAAQRRVSRIPRPGLVLIERHAEAPQGLGFAGKEGLTNFFFHTLAGRGANDTLARVAAWRLEQARGVGAEAGVDDYGFLLTVRRGAEPSLDEWRAFLAPAGAEDALHQSLKNAELVRWQFRHVAQTGLMVPRQLLGAERRHHQMRFSAELLYRVLDEHEPDHILLEETRRQVLHYFLDFPRAQAWMESAAASAMEWEMVETPQVSPFAFPLYASRVRESHFHADPEAALEQWHAEMFAECEEGT